MSKQKTLKIREVIAALRKNERFMVATHVRPDGDAIGSLLAMKLILQHLGKQVDIYAQDRFPPEFDFLPDAREVRNKPLDSTDYQVAILVDCGDFDRVGDELIGVHRRSCALRHKYRSSYSQQSFRQHLLGRSLRQAAPARCCSIFV